MEPAFPALTCTAQATYLSGRAAGAHGVAGNGWFDRTCVAPPTQRPTPRPYAREPSESVGSLYLSLSLARALSCSSMSPLPPSHTRSRHTRTPACCLLHRYCEIKNWHQSSKNVLAQRLWTDLKREAPSATVFVNGWWHGMYVPSRGVPHFHCVWLYSAQTRCISCTRCTNCIRSTCIVVPAHCPRQ